ncbi:hypothetical protein BaRGS_00028466, partial [Batillaria attramentaria]
ECFAERRVTGTLDETFTLGCESAQVCERLGAQPIGKRDLSVCSQCCAGSNCNANLCTSST